MDAVAEMGGPEADTEGGHASLFREARIAYGAASQGPGVRNPAERCDGGVASTG